MSPQLLNLREQLLAENHNDVVEAAAILAERLTRGEPLMLKVGYSQENAVLAAIDIFPEITAEKIWVTNRWEKP